MLPNAPTEVTGDPDLEDCGLRAVRHDVYEESSWLAHSSSYCIPASSVCDAWTSRLWISGDPSLRRKNGYARDDANESVLRPALPRSLCPLLGVILNGAGVQAEW